MLGNYYHFYYSICCMKSHLIICLFLYTVLIVQTPLVFAFETDQYNLPPKPLADIGDEITEYTKQNVQKAFEKVNAEISRRQECLKIQDT